MTEANKKGEVMQAYNRRSGMNLRIVVYCLMSVLIPSALTFPQGGPVKTDDAQEVGTARATSLSPESLEMPRTSILFSGRKLRIFNGRGAVSLRDMTVTGLQHVEFPPIDVLNYHFQLALRENRTKVLIQDIVPDVYQHYLSTGQGPHPLGLNFQTPGAPFVMLLQQAYWQPNLFLRTGTFHKEFNGQWISFGIETKTRVSAESDEIYLEVQIKNRRASALEFTVIPQQSAPELALAILGEQPQPAGPVNHPNAFTLASNQIRITAVSDLAQHTADGWSWEIPGKTEQTARFALVLQRANEAPPNLYAPDIAQRMERADRAMRDRLEWAAKGLPEVSTADKQFNDLYYRCILSVLNTRWERKNFVIRPFYAVGTWPFSVAWDISYASEMLSVLDPQGLRETILAYLRTGFLKTSYIPWNGKTNEYWYAQSPFAVMQTLQDYIRQTGNEGFLNERVGSTTVFEWMKRAGQDLVKRYGRPDGLLDFGPGSERMIELRTDGYQHVVAATNGLAVEYFRQIAEWCRERHDPEAAQFDRWAGQTQESMEKKLWDNQNGWFINLYPDGSRHLVWSYHLFDLLGTGILTEAQRQRLISHLTEGQFLGPYGMYSISKVDTTHWDFEDTDWGGGGQYTGMPLRIAESLYREGYGELGWDILRRCSLWTKGFPYIPQETFTDFPGYPEAEMALELAAGSGVQAVLFGVFGLRPHLDGSLEIQPSYHQELGEARMTGYRFRGHSYDVIMDPWKFHVYKDGKLIAQHPYGEAVNLPRK